jgi:hypothetical protein
MSNKIKLSDNSIVEITEFLTWGQIEKIRGSMVGNSEINMVTGQSKMNSSTMIEYKKTAIQTCVKSIKKDEKDIEFSTSWLESLPYKDGDLIWEKVNELIIDEDKKKD